MIFGGDCRKESLKIKIRHTTGKKVTRDFRFKVHLNLSRK